jgi:tyrosine-protein phosphatase YwqE
MIKRNLVHCLVSDGHDPVRRPLVLSTGYAAATALVDENYARQLVADNPGKIVRNQKL